MLICVSQTIKNISKNQSEIRLNILIAEDEPYIAFIYFKTLNDQGHRVIITRDGEEFLIRYNEILQKVRETTNAREHIQPFDVVIVDNDMPKMDGLEVVKEIFSINFRQRIIVASSFSIDKFSEAAKRFSRSLEILLKPFSPETLVNLVEHKGVHQDQLKEIEDILGKRNLDEE